MNILVGQSGGPTAAINSSLAGIISAAFDSSKIETVYGALHGIEGFLDDRVFNINNYFDFEKIELLKTTPGAFLKSCRYPLPEDLNDPIYPKIFEKLDMLWIGAFIYIGGNDSMTTVDRLSRYAKKIGHPCLFLGVPKTVDNDLPIIDHCPGYGSAAKYVATQVRNIGMDICAYKASSVTIVEIMGRHAGWLTASSILARKYKGDNPLYIYLPEVPFSIDRFFADIEDGLTKQDDLLICVSEGIRDKDGKFISEYNSAVDVDSFGHKYLKGCGIILEKLVKDKFKIKTRSIELSLPQRCAAECQSAVDIQEAFDCGVSAIKAVLDGENAKMVCINRISNTPYKVNYSLIDVTNTANKEKFVPANMILPSNNDVSEEFIDYCLPLIQGETKIKRENSLPTYLQIEC